MGSGGSYGDVNDVSTAPAAHAVVVADATGVDERRRAPRNNLDATISMFVAENVKLWLDPVHDHIGQGG
jgi:hypothetical protein